MLLLGKLRRQVSVPIADDLLHALSCNNDMQYMLLCAELHICYIQQIWHIAQVAEGQRETCHAVRLCVHDLAMQQRVYDTPALPSVSVICMYTAPSCYKLTHAMNTTGIQTLHTQYTRT